MDLDSCSHLDFIADHRLQHVSSISFTSARAFNILNVYMARVCRVFFILNVAVPRFHFGGGSVFIFIYFAFLFVILRTKYIYGAATFRVECVFYWRYMVYLLWIFIGKFRTLKRVLVAPHNIPKISYKWQQIICWENNTRIWHMKIVVNMRWNRNKWNPVWNILRIRALSALLALLSKKHSLSRIVHALVSSWVLSFDPDKWYAPNIHKIPSISKIGQQI